MNYRRDEKELSSELLNLCPDNRQQISGSRNDGEEGWPDEKAFR
jgi:hypothetical protein